MKKLLLSAFLAFLPASLFAGTHVMQDDASLTIGSMTLTTGGQGIHFADGTTQTTAGTGGGGGYSLEPATVTIQADLGITASTGTLGSSTDTTLGNNPWVVINASGTSQALTITGYGNPSGGVQNQSGLVNIINPLGSKPSAELVIIDSVTDAQVGAGEFEIWSNNPLKNDPIIWIHRTSSNSSPEMRWDGPSPNMEMVMNHLVDNTIGEGKWEPFAIASGSKHLQCGSNRANDNGTFENLCEEYPLYSATEQPGIYLHAQTLANDSGILSSSDTAVISFFSVNSHTTSLTGPLNPLNSYALGLPILPKATGLLLYNAGNRGGNFSVRQTTWTDTDFTYATTTGVKISTLTITGQSTVSNLTVVSSASLVSNVTLGDAGNSVTVSSNIAMPGSTFYQNGTESLGTVTAGVWNGTAISANSYLSGTIQADQFPALTGDITTTAGLLATTAAGTQANITTLTHAITATSSMSITGQGGLAVTFGVSASTVAVSSNTILGAATYYANGVVAGASINANELTGTLQAAQEPAHTGDVTNSAGSIAMTAAGTQANITNFSHALTMTSSVTVNASVQISTLNITGGFNYTPSVKTSNYTMTPGDSVIMASCPLTIPSVTITLPPSNSIGEIAKIFNVSAGTNPVIIVPAGTDLIMGSTIYYSYAKGQSWSLISDGTGNWWADGKEYISPPWIGPPNVFAGSAAAMAASSDTINTCFSNDTPGWVYALRLNVGVTNGTVDLGIQDQWGNLLRDSGVVACPSGTATVNLTSPLYVGVGTYCTAVQASNVTATFTRYSSGSELGCYTKASTTMGIPSPMSYTSVGARCPGILGLVYGGFTL